MDDDTPYEIFRLKKPEAISQIDWAILGRLESDVTRAAILRKKLCLNSVSPIPDESVSVELKGGFRAIPGTFWDRLPNGGIKLVITEAAAIYNSVGQGGRGAVWVGIADGSKRPTGLETQIACMYPGLSRDKVESTVLFNLARNWTNNDSFLSSIEYEWVLLNGHLVLKMGIHRTNNDIVLCNPKDWMLPYRVGTSLRLARGFDFVKIINMLNNN